MFRIVCLPQKAVVADLEKVKKVWNAANLMWSGATEKCGQPEMVFKKIHDSRLKIPNISFGSE